MPANDQRKLHPFFERPNDLTVAEHVTSSDEVCDIPADHDVKFYADGDHFPAGSKNRTCENEGKANKETPIHFNEDSNSKLEACRGNGTEFDKALHQPSIFHILQSRPDLRLQQRESSRKRRRITAPESLQQTSLHGAPQTPHSGDFVVQDEVDNDQNAHPNRNGLGKWNNSAINSSATATMDMPEYGYPAESHIVSQCSEWSNGNPGAEYQSQVQSSASTKLVILRYGEDDEVRRSTVGQNIEAILQRPRQKQALSKPTHPFFRNRTTISGQNKPRGANVPCTDPAGGSSKTNDSILSFSTPGRMRYQAHKRFDALLSDDADETPVQLSNIIRIPGTFDAPWPAKGFVNVGCQHLNESGRSSFSNRVSRAKKKNVITRVPPGESVLRSLVSKEIDCSSLHMKASAPQLTHRPTRLIMSGSDLCNRALKHLDPSLDKNGRPGHRKFQSLLRTIVESMTPFDNGECEGIPWTQKHMPKSTEEVLQPQRVMQVLRSWLEKHAVKSTDTGAMKPVKHDSVPRKSKKRRRRRSNELADFIVESDDESKSMRDLSDDETHGSSTIDNASRSLVRDDFDDRSTKDRGRRDNAVLVSGPHGCGKTAAVFAAANELGFEVFEIGPGSTRGGKEILEKVGDMALNHIVSHKSTNHSDGKVESDDSTPTTPAKNQKKLSSMFRAAPTSRKSAKLGKDGIMSASRRDQKPSTRHKQSLILFEEVDVLFDQDKQFWETVMDLAVQSKRPIVMTCTDESLVPKDNLMLHALLRLRPPPDDLAAKYLVLLAAAEGHLISYDAAATLYKLRCSDLRASIIDLDFWCQMAIGDQKGGLEWHLDRWPPGVDLDDRGHKLRIVSENTIVSGTGVFDQLHTDLEPTRAKSEEILLEAWSEFGLEPSQVSSAALTTLGGNSDPKQAFPKRRRSNLGRYEFFSDLISATDVFSVVDLPSAVQTQEIQDPTQPPLSDSQMANFTEKPRLLLADPLADYGQFDVQASLFIHLSIKQLAAAEFLDSDLRPKSHRLDPYSLSQELLEVLLGDHDNPQCAKNVEPAAKDIFTAFEYLRDNSDGSCLDRQSHIIAEDVAPYIRSIAAYEIALEQNRQILYTGAERTRDKGLRKTRASRSALVGGRREDTRKERWFGEGLDLNASLNTGMQEWRQLSFDTSTRKNGDENHLEPATGHCKSGKLCV